MPIHDLPVLSVGLAPHHHVEAHDSAFCGVGAPGSEHGTSFCGISAPVKASSFCGVEAPVKTSSFCGVGAVPVKASSFCGVEAPVKASSFCGVGAASSDQPTSFIHNHHDPAIKETSFQNDNNVIPGLNPLGKHLDGTYQKVPVNIKLAGYRYQGDENGVKFLPEGPNYRLITQPRGDAIQIRYCPPQSLHQQKDFN